MTQEEYMFSTGFFGKGDPNKVVRALLKLKKNGRLTPERVVRAARNPKSPLHACFEWDDQEAARKYRLYQARNLILSVRVKHEEEPEQEPLRVFVRDEDDEGSHYREVVEVTEVESADFIMNNAIQDLVDWVGRYEELADRLPGVFAEVHKAIRAEKKRRAA